jgi:hypothetical protein
MVHDFDDYSTSLPGSFSSTNFNLVRNAYALFSSLVGTVRLKVFGPVVMPGWPSVGTRVAALFFGLGARKSMMSTFVGFGFGATPVKEVGGMAVIWGM